MRLHQQSTVDLYLSQFEKFQEQIREKMPFLTDDYFVECFIGGLQAEIREALKMLNPGTVVQAYRVAKQCEVKGGNAKKVKEKQESLVNKESTISQRKEWVLCIILQLQRRLQKLTT